MTPQEVIQEIKHFSVDEKNFLIERITESLRETTQTENENLQFEDEKRELTINDKVAIVHNLYGSLRAENEFIPMSKDEERELRFEYLMEKYG